jgi:multiple sugar transport system substrate-binding protein
MSTLPPAEGIHLHQYGINWMVDTYNELIDEWFEAENPGIQVTYHGLSDYGTEMGSILATNPSQVDLLMVRYPDFVPWIESGYLHPVDDEPGFEAWIDLNHPMVEDTYTYEGHFYCGAWYRMVFCMYYNERILDEAGFSNPPETWEELVEQCIAIQDQEICEYPVTWPLIANADRLSRVWMAIAVSMDGTANTLFDASDEPTWTDPTSAGYKAAEFLYNCTQVWNINPAASLETEYFPQILMMADGDLAFTVEAGPFQLKLMNDASASAEAGNCKLMLWPDSNYGCHQTGTGIGISQACVEKGEDWQEAAWKYFQWYNGKDVAKNATALMDGSATTYPAVDADPEVRADWATFMDLDVWDAQNEKLWNFKTDINRASLTPYWGEWERDYIHVKLQACISGDITVAQAMQDIYDGWVTLSGGS